MIGRKGWWPVVGNRTASRDGWLVRLVGMLGLLCALGSSGRVDAAGYGNTVTTPYTLPNLGSYLSLTLDAAGYPVIAQHECCPFNLHLLHCDDMACNTGNVHTMPDPGSGSFVSIALDATGFPVVAYLDGTTPHALKVLHCNDPNCADGDDSIAVVDSSGSRMSLVLDASGNPVVSYYQSQSGLKVLHCGNPLCTADNSIVLADILAESSGGRTSLALDASGNPVVAYSYRVSPGALSVRVLHCGDPDCASNNVIASPDQSDGDVLWPSLALDSSGNPVIAYYEPITTGDLLVLRCGNDTCTSGNSIVSPLPAEYDSQPSLVLDSSDRPLIAYQDGNGRNLRLLRCGDATCSAGNHAVTLDKAGDVGSHAALALDGAGNAVIAYRDSTNDELKVARCASPSCDFDDDRCGDTFEELTGPGSETGGGLRSPKNPNDYFNPSGDGVNRVDDILLVVNQYFDDDDDGNPGLPPYAPGYDPDTDRTLVGPNAWDLGPPNGLQRVDDILNIVKQYFHDCS